MVVLVLVVAGLEFECLFCKFSKFFEVLKNSQGFRMVVQAFGSFGWPGFAGAWKVLKFLHAFAVLCRFLKDRLIVFAFCCWFA